MPAHQRLHRIEYLISARSGFWHESPSGWCLLSLRRSERFIKVCIFLACLKRTIVTPSLLTRPVPESVSYNS